MTTAARSDEVLCTQKTGVWGWRICWGLLALMFFGGLLANLEDGLADALISAVAYLIPGASRSGWPC